MKKLISLIVALIAMPMAAQTEQETTTANTPLAQDQFQVYENTRFPIYLGEITYEPMSKGQKTSNVLTGLMNGEVSVEDESMVEGAKQALASSLREVPRFMVKTGEISEEDMDRCAVFSAKIIFCNFTERLNNYFLDKEGRIVAYITLTNPKNNHVFYSKQITGESWLSAFESMAECREFTQNNLLVAAASNLRKVYPLRGHMLEKGFMKGKKQKLQEFYIDLGSAHHTFRNTNVDVYVVKRIAGRVARQYLGSGTVIDVQGEDISLCKVTKNGDQIKEAFDRGAEIAVQVY